jgi:hypothetical protein
MHIAGAQKHRLVGDPWADEPEVKAEPPAKVSAKPKPLRLVQRGQRDVDIQQQRPREQIPLRQPGHRSGMEYLSSTNIYGLTSRSELFYPELFRPISRRYWLRTSDAEQAELIRRQAEIVEKLGYRDQMELTHIPNTQADLAYDAAVARRHMAIRRRRKKRGYEGKKQEEEERRKAPLVRRYIQRDARFGITPIMTVGALETPVVISGLLRKAPGRTRIDFDEPNYDEPSWTPKPPQLPVIDPSKGPKVEIQEFNNMFGLRSRPVASYPEAYAKVSQAFWRSMTPEHRRSVMAVQASAMEKVGFEQGTTKYFIRDFDPMQQNIYSTGRERPGKKNQARPISIYACVLLILLGFLSAMPVLFGTADYGWLAFSVALVITGVTLGIPMQR